MEERQPEHDQISELKVMKSAAGYYLGEEQYDQQLGDWMPYNRFSGYMDEKAAYEALHQRQLEQIKQSMPENLISSIEKEYGSFDYIKERPEDRGYYAITQQGDKFNSLEITKGSTGYTIYTEKDVDKDLTLSSIEKNIQKDLQKEIPMQQLSR